VGDPMKKILLLALLVTGAVVLNKKLNESKS
jgi:hypothetical protein